MWKPIIVKSLPPPLSSPPWTGRTKRVVAIAVAVAIGLAVLRLSEVIPIIAVAVILAYLLTPLVNFIDERVLVFRPFKGKPHRNFAVLLTYILIITIFVLVVLVVVPALIRQFEELGSRIPNLVRSLENSMELTLSEPLTFNGEPILINGSPFIPLEQLQAISGVQQLTDVIQLDSFDFVGTTQSFISSLSGPAFSVVGGALTAIINIIFMLSMMFFLMRDGSHFINNFVQITPAIYRGDLRRMLYELGQVWNAYLRGQLTLALTMGTVVFIVATLLGLPNPLILGLISGLLEFIPSLGPGLAIFPAALLAFTSQSTTLPFLEGVPFAIVVIIIWAALQNIEAIILVPRVMGGSLNLHPFVVIVAIITGAALAGLLGIILAAPMVASLRVFGQYIYGKLMDKDPFPTQRVRVVSTIPITATVTQRLVAAVKDERVARLGEQMRERFSPRKEQQ